VGDLHSIGSRLGVRGRGTLIVPMVVERVGLATETKASAVTWSKVHRSARRSEALWHRDFRQGRHRRPCQQLLGADGDYKRIINGICPNTPTLITYDLVREIPKNWTSWIAAWPESLC